jgi:peptidoglycan/LPS O-acetylase OafA/YrhL
MSAQALTAAEPKSKITYIDNLKVLMIVLVVLHHAFITYGAPGGWYYVQKTTHEGALIFMTLFVAVNQAFFMGFFFFLSALFVPASYNKKGPARFIRDRLLRLGVPLLFYSLILSPVLNYTVEHFGYKRHNSFTEYMSGYHHWVDFGVLWFVAALLLFTLLYAAWRALFKKPYSIVVAAPSANKILLFALGLGILSFIVRIVFPVGWVLHPVGFQLGHFPQYIVLFILGLIASQNDWLGSINYRDGKKLALIARCIIFIIFPLFYVLLIWLKFPSSYFSGGFHWPSLLYALWEQVTGLCIIAALLSVGKQRWNKPSAFLSRLSRSAFAVYIFHPLVLIFISLAVKDWVIDPALKLLVVAPLAVLLSFLAGSILVLLPGVKRII